MLFYRIQIDCIASHRAAADDGRRGLWIWFRLFFFFLLVHCIFCFLRFDLVFGCREFVVAVVVLAWRFFFEEEEEEKGCWVSE